MGRNKSVFLSIPQPCGESWDAMTPEAGGRHCTGCQKTIVDFSSMSNEEILAFLVANPHACGRFANHQLERSLPVSQPVQSPGIFSRLLLGFTFGLGMLNTAFAQTSNSIPGTVQTSPSQPEKRTKWKPLKTKDWYEFKGQVINARTNLPIANASVKIPDLKMDTLSNQEGKFSFRLPNSTAGCSFKILCSASGFLDSNEIILLLQKDTFIQINMREVIPIIQIHEIHTMGAPMMRIESFVIDTPRMYLFSKPRTKRIVHGALHPRQAIRRWKNRQK